MTYEETLGALQGMMGKQVLVSIGPVGDPQPRVGMTGVLRRGEESPMMGIMQRLGGAAPDDEGLLFHVGGSDSPGEKNYFSLTKEGFVEAGHSALGGSSLYIECGGLVLTIGTKEEAERALGPPAG